MLGRDSLINLGITLEIDGHKNFFNKPYLKKEKIKELIKNKLREHKKNTRSNSLKNTHLPTSNNTILTHLCFLIGHILIKMILSYGVLTLEEGLFCRLADLSGDYSLDFGFGFLDRLLEFFL